MTKNIECLKKTATELEFKWDVPKNNGSVIDYYLIKLINEEETKETYLIENNNNNCIFKNLHPFTKYAINVKAHNQLGFSKKSIHLVFQTNPYIPNKINKITCLSKNINLLKIGWEIPRRNGSNIDFYKIIFIEKDHLNKILHVDNFITLIPQFSLNNLLLNSQYSIQIQAHNDFGYSLISNELLIKIEEDF